MVIQILPRDERMSELGASVENTGSAIGTGLGYLIGSKVAQVRARNAFESFGVDKTQADKLSRLPMNMRNVMLQDLSERKGFTEASSPLQPQTQRRLVALAAMQMMPQQQSMGIQAQPVSSPMMPQRQSMGVQAQPVSSPMLQAQQGAQVPFQQAQAQMAVGGLSGMMTGSDQGLAALQQARQQGLMGYQAPIGQQQPLQVATQPQRQLGEAPRPMQSQSGVPPQLPSEAPVRSQMAINPQQQIERDVSQALNSQPTIGRSPYSGGISGPSPKFRAQMLREARAQRDLELKEIEAERKAAKDRYAQEKDKADRDWEFNKKEFEKIRDRAIEALEVDKSYDRLIYYAESGQLKAGDARQLLDKLGLGSFKLNVATQGAQKEIARLAQGIGSTALGRGRLTNFLEQTYQKALPSLWNTPKGIILVSKINKLDGKAQVALNDAMRELKKERGGFNFDADEVYERAQPRIDELQREAFNVIDEALGIRHGSSLASAHEGNNTNYQQPGDGIGGYLGVIPRAAEEVAGLPGNIVAGAAGLGRWAVGNDNLAGRALKVIEDYAPTSEAIRQNITKPLTGEFFEPKSYGQELAQDVASTAASLAGPGSAIRGAKALRAGAGFARAGTSALEGTLGAKKILGISVLGTAAQQAAAELGYGKLEQGLAKAATILTGSMYGGREQLRAIEDKAYSSAREIAGDVRQPAKEMAKSYETLKKSVGNAAMDSNEQNQVLNMINSIKRNISKGTIEVNAAHEAKKQINDYLYNQGSTLSKTAKGFLQKAKQPLIKTLDQYAENSPEFGKYYHLGEELHKGLAAQNKLTAFLNEHTSLQNLVKNPVIKLGLGWGVVKTAGVYPSALGAGLALGTREASKLFDLLQSNPTARTHYLNLIKASRVGAVNEAAKALRGLDKEADSYF